MTWIIQNPYQSTCLGRIDFQAMYIYDILIHAVYVCCGFSPYIYIYSLHTNIIFHICYIYIYHVSGDSFSPMKNQPGPQTPMNSFGQLFEVLQFINTKDTFSFRTVSPSVCRACQGRFRFPSRGKFSGGNISKENLPWKIGFWGGLEEGKLE